MKIKIGRNDPCPCGSGKKYKKCCLITETSTRKSVVSLPPEMVKGIDLHVREMHRKTQIHQINEQIRQERYGQVRPIIHEDFQDYKFVAVGGKLYYSKEWKTFPDFLRTYPSAVFGKEWGEAELKKPYTERHQIVKWFPNIFQKMINRKREKDGTYSGAPDGVTAAYMRLSYDLYILRHHAALQNELIRRLKNKDQFQGARHELFVAATFIRAGFDISFEDESDRSRKHPEFKAIHNESKESLLVEAKSRHRPGVMGFTGAGETPSEYKTGVKRILNRAIKKALHSPYFVFIDLNLPPSEEEINEKPWFKDVKLSIGEEGLSSPQKPDPFNLVVFSNHPDHYVDVGEPCPKNEHVFVIPKYPMVKLSNEGILSVIIKAVNQYGAIPNFFPPDWDSGVIHKKL